MDETSLLIALGLLGLMVGSFLNVVIFRLPLQLQHAWKKECSEYLALPPPSPAEQPVSLLGPRSQCTSCAKIIAAYDNIPVLSFLLLKGKCRHCKAPISLQYPFIELLTSLLSVITAWHFGYSWQSAAALLITWYLIAITFIDLKHTIIPDNLTLPLLWLGLLINSFYGVFTNGQSALLGTVLGYMSLWSLYWGFKLATKKEGMGYGDFKLLAMLGAWMGWQYLPITILLASVVGAIVGLIPIMFAQKDKNIPIPFGPYLALSGWMALLWGDTINHAYLTWAGFR